MTSESQKERAQKTIPGGAITNESFWKSQNDILKSKRTSANNYPRRNEKKRIALQSLWMTSKSQKERAQKTIPGGTKKKRAPQTFWRPHSYRFQDSNTNNQHVLIKNPIASQLPTQITTTAHLNYPKTYMNYPKYNGMWCRVVGRLR